MSSRYGKRCRSIYAPQIEIQHVTSLKPILMQYQIYAISNMHYKLVILVFWIVSPKTITYIVLLLELSVVHPKEVNLESTTQFYKSDIDTFMLHIQKIK